MISARRGSFSKGGLVVVLLDLTREISEETQVFPAYPKVHVLLWAKHDVHGFRSEVLYAVTHVATHIDAPLHFKEDGASIDELPLDLFTGYAVVVNAEGHHAVPREVLEEELERAGFVEGDAVFIYTGWEHVYGKPEYITRCPGLTREAALLLVERKAKIVGMDSPSIDPAESTTFDAHHVLLGSGVLVIENLCNLKDITGRRLRFYAFPLKIKGATASPARVVVEA